MRRSRATQTTGMRPLEMCTINLMTFRETRWALAGTLVLVCSGACFCTTSKPPVSEPVTLTTVATPDGSGHTANPEAPGASASPKPFACPPLPARPGTTAECESREPCVGRLELEPPEAAAAADGSLVAAGGHYVLEVLADGLEGRCELDSPLPECTSEQSGLGWSDVVPCSVPWLRIHTGCGGVPAFLGLAGMQIDGCPKSVKIKVQHGYEGGAVAVEEREVKPTYELIPSDEEGCEPACYVGLPQDP
jgi:hypothetical protein